MAVRTSEGRYLEVLAQAPALAVPIEVDVFDGASPSTMLVRLENASEVSVLEELSQLGSGSFWLPRTDPKATAANLARGNLVKVATGGIYRTAFWVEEPATTIVSTAEAGGERVLVAGRGALAYLEQAVCYPEVWPTQAVQYVGKDTSSNGGSGDTKLTLSKPAGVQKGDVLIAAVVFRAGSERKVNPPNNNWKSFQRVENGDTIGVELFRRKAANAEPADYTWTFRNTGTGSDVTKASGGIVALRYAPGDVTEYGFSSKYKDAAETDIKHPSLDVPSVEGVLLTFAAATAGAGMTPPAGMTETIDHTATDRVLHVSRLVAPELGATGQKVTVNSTAAKWLSAMLFVPNTASLEVDFEEETPGVIFGTLLEAAQSRGALPFLSWDFTDTADSAGQPWPDTFSLSFHVGTTLLDVWNQLVELGVEGEMSHDLRLSMYVDHSREKSAEVIFRKGWHLLGDVVDSAHLAGLRTRMLAEGAGGRVMEVGPASSESDPKVGRREGFVAFSTTDTATALSRGATRALTLSGLEDAARTVPVTHGLAAVGQYEPWVDYRLGDWVGLDSGGTGVATRERLVAVTLTQRVPLDYDVSLALNSVVLEASIRLKRRIDAMEGSAAGGSGSSSYLGTGGGKGGKSSKGRVSVDSGDSAGFLMNKLEVDDSLVKTKGGTSGARTVKLAVDVAGVAALVPPAALSDSGWKYVGAVGQPAFQNSWVNYGSWGDASFRRIGNIVYLQGLIKSGGTTAVMFTLPVGYRPETKTGTTAGHLFAVISNAAMGRVDVYPNGNVQANGVNATWVSLENICFPTADAFPS